MHLYSRRWVFTVPGEEMKNALDKRLEKYIGIKLTEQWVMETLREEIINYLLENGATYTDQSRAISDVIVTCFWRMRGMSKS